MPVYSSALAKIGSSLNSAGDILLYGCNVAQGDIGQSFINTLAQLTGADVAASTDLTGAASLGGNSILEANSGVINASSLDLNNYQNLLLVPVNTAPTFLMGSIVTTNVGITTEDAAKDIAVLTNGKMIVAGNSNGRIVVTRYNADGTLDASFSGDGKAIISFSNTEIVKSMAVQADGKIVIISDFTNTATHDVRVSRLNADGSLDTGFNSSGTNIITYGTDNQAGSVVLQADGKILVALTAAPGATSNDFVIVRFNTNGTLDTSFNSSGVVVTNMSLTDVANSILVQPDGKIIVAGSNDVGASADFAIARYNTNGSLDTTFGGGDGNFYLVGVLMILPLVPLYKQTVKFYWGAIRILVAKTILR